jgi:hypothetical protein
MKKLVFLTSALLLAGFLSAQEVVKDTTKDESKKVDPREVQFRALGKLLESKSFVLKARSTSDKQGNQRIVNNSTNFVMVDSTKSTIQIGDEFAVGPNGVGGVTVKGTISSWKVTKDTKRKTYFLQMFVMAPFNIYDIYISIYDFESAKATISGFSSDKLIFEGSIVPLNESRVYVGTHL